MCDEKYVLLPLRNLPCLFDYIYQDAANVSNKTLKVNNLH